MKGPIIILLLILAGTVIAPFGICQEPDREAEKEMEEMERERIQEEKEFLEELKRTNPVEYKEYLAEKKERERKREIIRLYRNGKISEKEARSRLRPFVEKEVDPDSFVESIDERIAMHNEEIDYIKKEIKHLNQIKRNPRLLIEDRIDSHLGKSRER